MDMLVKSESLTSVANAIREKGGTNEQLVFPAGFEAAIMAIHSGGVSPQLIVTAPEGSTITAVNGEETVTGVVGTEGTLTISLPSFGMWVVTGTKDGDMAETEVEVVQDYFAEFEFAKSFTINGGHGETITISENGNTITSVTLSSTGSKTVSLSGVANKTLKFKGSLSGYEKTVNVGNEKELTVNVYPDGVLYWYGRQFNDKTGGFSKTGDGSASITNSPKFVVDGSSEKFAVIATASKIAFDKTKKSLKFKVQATSSDGDYSCGLVSSRGSESYTAGGQESTSSGINKTKSIDISSVSGSFYVQFGCYNTKLTVSEIYME